MKVELTDDSCIVTAQKKDGKRGPKYFYKETVLLHHVRWEICLMGFDIVKKGLKNDKGYGHMAKDWEHCHIRSRNYRSKLPHFRIFNKDYPNVNTAAIYRKTGQVIFQIDYNVFGQVEKCANCGRLVSFERLHERNCPPEYEVCDLCERHFCSRCINWRAMKKSFENETACYECVREGRLFIGHRRKLFIPGGV